MSNKFSSKLSSVENEFADMAVSRKSESSSAIDDKYKPLFQVLEKKKTWAYERQSLIKQALPRDESPSRSIVEASEDPIQSILPQTAPPGKKECM